MLLHSLQYPAGDSFIPIKLIPLAARANRRVIPSDISPIFSSLSSSLSPSKLGQSPSQFHVSPLRECRPANTQCTIRYCCGRCRYCVRNTSTTLETPGASYRVTRDERSSLRSPLQEVGQNTAFRTPSTHTGSSRASNAGSLRHGRMWRLVSIAPRVNLWAIRLRQRIRASSLGC